MKFKTLMGKEFISLCVDCKYYVTNDRTYPAKTNSGVPIGPYIKGNCAKYSFSQGEIVVEDENKATLMVPDIKECIGYEKEKEKEVS